MAVAVWSLCLPGSDAGKIPLKTDVWSVRLTDKRTTYMLTIQDLVSRYGVSRQILYECLRASQVSPVKRGNRSLFNEEMVATLDAQRQRLKDGFNLRDSVGPTVIDVTPDTGLSVSELNALEAFAEALASAISQSSVQPTRALQVQRDLHEAAEMGYLISSK